ncbi:NAD-dependent epimerase/dehydratase family protein [Phormidium sp. CLA17]|nr:NAD-dependent epimerase/dehydratase family protein [Leptolyngbya sp. Cla-17]
MTNAVILGCGYVGRSLAPRWRQTMTVTATTTTIERLAELQTLADSAVVVKGNDEVAVRSLLQNQQVLLVSVGAPNANAYEETYLNTAKTVVAALKSSSVQQVIYTSSYAVYGNRGGEWVDETTTVTPINPKAEILAETERVLLSAAHDSLKVCVLRLGGIYGAGRELIKIFRSAAGSVRAGTGEEASNWIHIDDIVGAIAFVQQQSLSGIYNLVGTVPLTTQELLDRIFAAHNLLSVTWDASQPSSRSYNTRVSNQKLRDAGYEFIYSEIQETL